MKVVTKSPSPVSLLLTIALGVCMVAVSIDMIYQSNTAKATPIVDFNAGAIIDDSVFTNRNSMSAAQIQSFLDGKVPNCDTAGTMTSEFGGGTRAQYGAAHNNPAPFTCLKNYNEGGKSSAQIIYDTAQEFTINPQVLIVLLQKEQGLVTDTWPFAVQYRTATGYGCPDTAACDSQYFGLTNQLRWSARMFRAILNNSPTWYTPYLLGNNYIQWSPTAACGGSTVNIQNRSTQALYNYTPYQPNQAALNAGLGTGDSCSAYGNRNFYSYFTSWFGSTTGPDYAASFTIQTLYNDAALTDPVTILNGNYLVQPSQKVYAKVEATNTGRNQWDSSTSLGTTRPMDRTSVFKDSSWLSPQRVTHPDTQMVNIGATGIFKFALTAPSKMGAYSESFGIVQDGVAWTSDVTTFNFNIASTVTAPSGYVGNILNSGNTTLISGQTILSPDTYTALTLTTNGTLVLRRDFQIVWSTPPAGSGASVVMQSDGNLVLYSSSKVAIWNSGTPGRGASTLKVQEDGNLVIYNAQGYTWASVTAYPTSHLNFPTNNMQNEGVMYKGQMSQSSDRGYSLYLQTDGNLVLYSPSRAIWASNTAGLGATSLIMQADGNLVLYTDTGKAVWNTSTPGKGASNINVQPDGNLVVYSTQAYTWASWTVGR